MEPNWEPIVLVTASHPTLCFSKSYPASHTLSTGTSLEFMGSGGREQTETHIPYVEMFPSHKSSEHTIMLNMLYLPALVIITLCKNLKG